MVEGDVRHYYEERPGCPFADLVHFGHCGVHDEAVEEYPGFPCQAEDVIDTQM